MALSIAKVLNIEKDERSVVFLLLTQSVFLGIFAGALDVGANALFLDAYSANLMPRAFMISGAVGILFTSIYTFLQRKMRFGLFTILNLLVVIIMTGILRFGYSYTDDPAVTFALLVFMGPLIIISMLGFWGTAGRYFTLREGKRLFGIIDTGSIVGMILAFYAVPLLVRFNFEVYNTLLIGLASLFIAMLFQLIVLYRHRIGTVPVSAELKRRNKGFLSIFRKRYTSMMALFVILSVIAAFFIHYSFMWATEANYEDNRELTSFLGAFFGTMMIFTVVIKSTLYGWLMKNYGLKVSLLISPVLLLVLTVIAAVVGGFFGYTAEAASFTLFFLVISLSKLFNKSLKDAIESPSMKILYQSLDSGERFDIQAKIDGVVNEFTAFAAGLIMAGLLFMSFIHVIHFSYILIALLIIWVILGLSLYRLYRRTLDESLAAARAASVAEGSGEPLVESDVSGATMFREAIRLDPVFYYRADPDQLNRLLENDDQEKRKVAWELISGTLYRCPDEVMERAMAKSEDERLRKTIAAYAERLRFPGKRVAEDFRSADRSRVFAALLQTVEQQDESQLPSIIALLRDRDMQIRSAAIEAAGKLKVKEVGGYLVDYLGHPDLYAVTWSALVNMGEIVLDHLENAFHKTGTKEIVRLRIVRAMVSIGGPRANDLLFSKVGYHQRDVREAAIHGLYLNEYRPDEQQVLVLQDLIYAAVLAGAMNVAAEFVIRENDPGNGLYGAISEERKRTDHFIFTLLGIAYDRRAIGHVQQSIEDTDNDDTGFALELLSLIVDEQVYAYLDTYCDALSVPEKIRRLQNEMPVEIVSYDELLIDLINRDGLYTGSYLRICAIDALRTADDLDAGRYLAAQVFHPDPVISYTASQVLAGMDQHLYKDVTERMKMVIGEENTAGQVYPLSDESGIIRLVEELKSWRLFSDLEREVIYKFASCFVASGLVPAIDPDSISVIKTGSLEETVLSGGVVINLADYPAIFDQIDYLASHPEFRHYQVKRKLFRELLFDLPELWLVCNRHFSTADTAGFVNNKTI